MICQRWSDLAGRQQWRRLRPLLSGGLPPTPTDAADFLTMVDADLAHDTTPDLS
ncbi:hypothetical protein EV649_4998 [Kribbella sp. VKM Ac-2569]|uniref:hypothetical protein n=1 Tax=Kribbella sp. VKM Ac-2569 TaxID=2512220 RepID=UPI0010EFBE64|nr:hypothetical protein [Kribbella sp. VKM Ac-2569]RZT17456.1 hypothetical protein EV649_4998 [Kribbella sp. VKM Ac-2569]